ncbi:ABC transporter permease subunit [Gottfriedia solisilvae]|uniref:ABC transporter permease n=1 Tax=Gottfriedia solisilvae TaxID=1516104 RepID=A0A8J3AG17_9BACI|nr:ABC transporter permease subunit [Gottfriedia solisilvae]GGI12094.1 ABC transporter permease [Gottfriedia solisilvae]
MFSKALWLKHSKQSRLALILLYLVYVVILPFSYYNNIFEMNRALEASYTEYPFIYIGEFSTLAFISPILVLILSILLIGIERNTGGIDFQFSLPYTPRQLFLSKWIFGVVHIFIATVFLSILTLIIHYSTILHQYIDTSGFLPIFVTLFLFSIAFLTIGLAIGTLTGHYFSQTLFTIFTIFSPILIFFSVLSNLKGLFNKDFNGLLEIEKKIVDWSISFQSGSLSITKDFDQQNVTYPTFDFHNLVVILIYIFVFLVIGLLCYSRNANANNGKLFVYKKFGHFVNILFVYLSATSIAILTSTIANGSNVVVYAIGLLIGLIAGYYFYKRLNKFFE